MDIFKPALVFLSLWCFSLLATDRPLGQKKERARNANQSIHRAILRRMVLEEYAPTYADIKKLIEGKAREFQVSINDLRTEGQIINSLFTEVFDSDLISPSQRIEIEKRLGGSLEKAEKESSKPSYAEYQQTRIERKKTKDNLAAMVVSASLLGAAASVLFKFIETRTLEIEWLLSGAGVLVVSIAVLTALSVYRKTREADAEPSRGAEYQHSSEFEAEIAKILKKNGFVFVIEPSMGNMRPDFLVDLNGKKIAIEAKAWDGPIPHHFIRRTLDYLHKLLLTEKIDRAILVTRKQTSFPMGNLGSDKISVTTIDKLPSTLRETA